MFRKKPFIDLKEVWDWFGYESYELTLRAINRGAFPIHTYKLGNKTVIDKEAFDAFFLMKREDALEHLTHRIAQNRMRMKKILTLHKDAQWFAQRNTEAYIRREFPKDLDLFPPQEWDPVDEFPVELPPIVVYELKPDDIVLDGYYTKK